MLYEKILLDKDLRAKERGRRRPEAGEKQGHETAHQYKKVLSYPWWCVLVIVCFGVVGYDDLFHILLDFGLFFFFCFLEDKGFEE